MPVPRGHLSQVLNDATGVAPRQRLIRQIERTTRRRLIVYESLIGLPDAMIVWDDQAPLADLLSDLRPDEPLDLLLQSPGGLPDAAETLVRTVFRVHPRPFRVLVPGIAKSAATLIALSADSIVMGPFSQLGPIDPQVPYPRIGGLIPANAVIRAYNDLLKKQTLTPGELAMAAQFDLAFVAYCHQAVDRSESLAHDWLQRWMMAGNPTKAAEIAHKLARDPDYVQSHGRVINADDARALGLNIEFVTDQDHLWRLLWELHIRADVALKQQGGAKLFESRRGSLMQRALMAQGVARPTVPTGAETGGHSPSMGTSPEGSTASMPQ
jgi:hypothetical protein